jgi:hypothetical protein
MCLTLDPLRLLPISLAGCLKQQQQDVTSDLQEENRVLREQLGGRRLRLNDDQRQRWAGSGSLGTRFIQRETVLAERSIPELPATSVFSPPAC